MVAALTLSNDVSVKQQNDFCNNIYYDFLSNAVYAYLFNGLTLREIEEYYLGKDANGFFSRAVLNHLGIETDGSFRGIYSKDDLAEVIQFMMASGDVRMNNIGRILRNVKLD